MNIFLFIQLILSISINVFGISFCKTKVILDNAYGFHRNLKKTVSFTKNPMSRTFLIVENFTSAVYVDPYQIMKMFEHQDTQKVYVDQEIDLEQPQPQSKSFLVFIYSQATSFSEIIFHTPYHLRYHSPSTVLYSNATITFSSKLFGLLSSHEEYSGSKHFLPCFHNHSLRCDWRQIDCDVEVMPQLQVPVGSLSHEFWVKYITTISIFLSCLFIVYQIVTS